MSLGRHALLMSSSSKRRQLHGFCGQERGLCRVVWGHTCLQVAAFVQISSSVKIGGSPEALHSVPSPLHPVIATTTSKLGNPGEGAALTPGTTAGTRRNV